MKTIILDTDFIISCTRWKIDIQEQLMKLCDFGFKISYLDKTIEELKNKPNEALAEKIINNFNQITTSKKGTVDDILVELTNNDKSIIVATQDKELKEKLKKGKIVIITIRQRKYLVFV